MHDADSKNSRDFVIGFDVSHHTRLRVEKPVDIIRGGPNEALSPWQGWRSKPI